mmetsp:Transcript_21057/g.58544  ORF Transcript_21057/g.58544 Transcript_21057/m.58544 type:complete len:450 (-) Transcript_21057:563-1912(-)
MNIMVATKRQKKTVNNIEKNEIDGGDDKIGKEKSQNATFYRKVYMSLGAGAIAALLALQIGRSEVSSSKIRNSGSITNKSNDALLKEYELFPFLVDPKAVASSLSSSATAVLSTPTLPAFPIISRLEDCVLEWKPPNPPRKKGEWRSLFWLPSFQGSGGSNPSRRGFLIQHLIEGLFLGEPSEATASYGRPVKEFHMSVSGSLKRCVGISETIGCLTSHPAVSSSPDILTDVFRPDVIMPIRNPATAIPEQYTNKHIAYHSGTKQDSVEGWRNIRDQYFEGMLLSWMDTIRYWRDVSDANEDASPYYRTQLYVPFEDIVTSDASKGTAIVEQLSNLLSGTGDADPNTELGFFETTKSKSDYECLWYRTAKQEWERQQQIVGDYIPAYTAAQKTMMVQNLTKFAEEIEAGLQNGGGKRGAKDSVLAPLLRRYAFQIEHYVVVEDKTASSQ